MRAYSWVSVCLLLLSACASGYTPTSPPAQEITTYPTGGVPAPADPLTAAERARAAEIANRVLRERGLLRAETSALVGVELANAKTRAIADRAIEPADVRRQALVTFFRYDSNDGLMALVDLPEGNVAATETAPPQAVPLGAAEVQAAVSLAFAHERVRAILGDTSSYRIPVSSRDVEGDTVEGLRVLGADDRDSCFRNRCVDLFFRRGGRYIAGQRVTVDLTTRQVQVTTDEGARP